MVYLKEIKVRTNQKDALDLTDLVAGVIRESGIANGMALIQSPSRATGVVQAPRDENVLTDLRREMRNLVPARINYANETSPEDAAGCVKSALFGSSTGCVVKENALAGENIGVYYLDYDGPRDNICYVCVVGE